MTATPGVRREEFAPPPPPGLRTGVPAFVGEAAGGPVAEPVALARWADFAPRFGGGVEGGFLAQAVQAFFRNGGEQCLVVRVPPPADATGAAARAAFRAGLDALRATDEADLVCAPDVFRALAGLIDAARNQSVSAEERDAARQVGLGMQRDLLDHCARAGGRLALLDAAPGSAPATVLDQRARLGPSRDGALYYPWLLADAAADGGERPVPPCGHVAGTAARGDRAVGVHQAPANAALEGVLDVEVALGDAAQGELNPRGVNCIRAFPGRGVRAWGARTLADPARDPEWTYVGVRRVVLTLERWLARALPGETFEPAGPLLWARIAREVTGFLDGLYRRGALQGRSAAEAFYVRCDAATNPPEVRERGLVVTEIGVAPAVGNEFVVVRFTHGPAGAPGAGRA